MVVFICPALDIPDYVVEYGRANLLKVVGDEPSPWCNDELPISYSYIQVIYIFQRASSNFIYCMSKNYCQFPYSESLKKWTGLLGHTVQTHSVQDFLTYSILQLYYLKMIVKFEKWLGTGEPRLHWCMASPSTGQYLPIKKVGFFEEKQILA